jgi:L-lysine exporter family protein LysE/ArgO
MDFGLLKLGVLLGIGAAAPIGPVNVEIARRTLRGGFVHGFALGCGAVSVDVAYAIVSSFGVGQALRSRTLGVVLGVAGAVLLLWLAVTCFRGAAKALRHDPLANPTDAHAPRATGGSARGAYATGVFMTLLNPLTLAFWFVAVPGAVGPITKEPTRDLPMICAGVFVGTLCWVVLFAGALALAGAGRWRRPWWPAAADLLGGITLLGFALLALWRLSGSFL